MNIPRLAKLKLLLIGTAGCAASIIGCESTKAKTQASAQQALPTLSDVAPSQNLKSQFPCSGNRDTLALWRDGEIEKGMYGCTINGGMAEGKSTVSRVQLALYQIKNWKAELIYEDTSILEGSELSLEFGSVLLKDIDQDGRMDFSVGIMEARDGADPWLLRQIVACNGRTCSRQGVIPLIESDFGKYQRSNFPEECSLLPDIVAELDVRWNSYLRSWYEDREMDPPAILQK